MTVTYSRRVADAGLGTFFHLLLRWKGSIYKLLYRELIIFSLLYSFFSVVYRSETSRDAPSRQIYFTLREDLTHLWLTRHQVCVQ